MKISGFSFIHNYSSGYPIRETVKSLYPYVDEFVVVDMGSTDNTREVLKSLSVRIIDGEWGNKAGETLANAHALHTECEGDIIIHCEADEVFDHFLIQEVINQIRTGHVNISVQRIQVESNFQRVRWWPHYVHRIFPKGTVKKVGETTDKKDCEDMHYITGDYGYLWDCTNCFRDQWLNRIKKQSELRNGEPLNTLYAPEHINLPNRLQLDTSQDYFDNPLWTAKTTPLAIPYILKKLVGKTSYE